MSRDDDYEVGFGRPPKYTRFKKGQSGNPKGRSKGSRSFAAEVDEVLNRLMTVTENGRPKRISSQKAAMMRLMERALNGDVKALAQVVALARQHAAEKEARSAERSLSAEEAGILDRYTEDLLRNAGRGSAEGPKSGGPDVL